MILEIKIPMKNAGIWMDREKAHIVVLEGGKEHLVTLLSGININYENTGENKTSINYSETDKRLLSNYFNEIISYVKEVEALALYGNDVAFLKFETYLRENFEAIDFKIIDVHNAEPMTVHQVSKLIQNHY